MRQVILTFLSDYHREIKAFPQEALRPVLTSFVVHQVELVKSMPAAAIADLFFRSKAESKAAEVEDMLGIPRGS